MLEIREAKLDKACVATKTIASLADRCKVNPVKGCTCCRWVTEQALKPEGWVRTFGGIPRAGSHEWKDFRPATGGSN